MKPLKHGYNELFDHVAWDSRTNADFAAALGENGRIDTDFAVWSPAPGSLKIQLLVSSVPPPIDARFESRPVRHVKSRCMN